MIMMIMKISDNLSTALHQEGNHIHLHNPTLNKTLNNNANNDGRSSKDEDNDNGDNK